MAKTPEQMCEELVQISSLLPAFQLKIPLLSWEYEYHNGVNKLVKLLRKQGIAAKRSLSPYYDSYAECDWDLSVILGPPEGRVLEGLYSYSCGGSNCAEFYEDHRTFHVHGDWKKPQYDLETEFKILDVTYGPGQYKVMTRGTRTRSKEVKRPL